MDDDPSATTGRLFTELKRRRVFRVASVYAVAAWAVIEVADTVFPRLGLPDSAVTLVVLGILGLPLSIVLAWAFDVTPSGVKRTRSDAPLRPRAAISLALLLLLIVTVSAYFGFRRYMGDGTYAAASTDLAETETTVAVLPFRYSGDSTHEYLADGMVNLLSTRLDGLAGLRVVDPLALFGVLASIMGDPASPDAARLLAERLGAKRYVLGSISGAGGALHINATLYGPDGAPEGTGSATAATEAGLIDAIDDAARQLLAGRLGDTGGDLVRMPALTSNSVPALRAWLEGERLLRQADGFGAGEAIERAIGHDSLFALAWYKLSVARDWGAAGAPQQAAGRAFALREQLPLQQRALMPTFLSVGGSRLRTPTRAPPMSALQGRCKAIIGAGR